MREKIGFKVTEGEIRCITLYKSLDQWEPNLDFPGPMRVENTDSHQSGPSLHNEWVLTEGNIETNYRQESAQAAQAAREHEGEFLIICHCGPGLEYWPGTKFSDWNIKITRKLHNFRLTQHYGNIPGATCQPVFQGSFLWIFLNSLSSVELQGIRKLMSLK